MGWGNRDGEKGTVSLRRWTRELTEGMDGKNKAGGWERTGFGVRVGEGGGIKEEEGGWSLGEGVRRQGKTARMGVGMQSLLINVLGLNVPRSLHPFPY